MAVVEHGAGSDGEGGGRGFGRTVLLPLGFALCAVAAWEIVCRVAKISPVLLAPPSAVWQVLSSSYPILLQQAIPTTVETVVGFVLATILGVILGVAITISARVREALY